MSLEEEEGVKERRPIPYTEDIQEPPPPRTIPLVYIPDKPLDLFEKYRAGITADVHKVWPKTPDDYELKPFKSTFRYYDYGGQYKFICSLPSGQPTYIAVTEPFEREDGELANDPEERRRRLIISAS